MSFSGTCEIEKYEKGDNSYKESSDPFDRNVTKLRNASTNNLVPTLCRYLLRFRRSSGHKIFGARGDNSVREKGSVTMLSKFKSFCSCDIIYQTSFQYVA